MSTLKLDPVIKEAIEEKDVKVTSNVQGNIEYIKKEFLKRNKNIGNNREIIFTNLEKYDEKKEKIIQKKIIKEDIDKKEERQVKHDPILKWEHTPKPLSAIIGRAWYQVQVGTNQTTNINYYERMVKVYNDQKY